MSVGDDEMAKKEADKLPDDVKVLSREGAVIQFGVRSAPKLVETERIRVREQKYPQLKRRATS